MPVSPFGLIAAIVFFALFVVSVYLFLILTRRILSLRAKLSNDYRHSGFSAYKKFSAADLVRHNGLGGRRGLIAYKGKVHNVTALPHWIGGYHSEMHRAGTDLTKAMEKAPHPDTLLQAAPIVGDYDPLATLSGSVTVRELEMLMARHKKLMKLEMALAAAAVIIFALRYLPA